MPAPAPGEYRDVTVLFVDIVDFTATSHKLDGEDVYLLVDEAMRLLVGVVHQYEGAIDKFTGDGLMALFGTPLRHENDPERAVRAALEMLKLLQPLQARTWQRYGFDLQVRIGVNTGPVIAGQVGSDLHMEYTVIGETVNLASRLQSAAETGTILVSQETFRHTQPLFNFEVLPPLIVKGLPQPVLVFRPLGVKEKPGPMRGLPGLHVPLIGRAADLARLNQALDVVCQKSQRQVVFIAGEAGLGKSRLVAELRHTVAAEINVYQGSCLAHTRSSPLWLVADLLRNMLHLAESDPARLQYDSLRAFLSRLQLANDNIMPYLANLLGLPQPDPLIEARLRRLDAAMLQNQTHAALRQLLLAEANRTPTILIFEDLHWIDPASRTFLEFLIQATEGETALMLVLISRDGGQNTSLQPFVSAVEKEPPDLIELHLQALSDTAGQLLVEQLIPQVSPEARLLKDRIAERAAGNPLYAEEIVRMLVDQGGLEGEANALQVTPRAMALLGEVPGTVKGLLLARFDRLSEQLRAALQKAAVLGMSFPVNLLQLLNGVDPTIMAEQLSELVTRQFLIARSLGWTQGYAFRHALIQEAIYGTLLKRDRQAIHTRVARVIERSDFWPPDEQTEVLAYHYAESTNPALAAPYLIKAAENAARRSAYETAIEHYRRAMTLGPQEPGASNEAFFRTRIGLGQALKFVGELAAANQVLLEALQPLWGWSLAAGPVSWPILVDNLRELADVWQREGAYDKALIYLEAGQKLLGKAKGTETTELRCSLLERIAWVRFRQGHLEEAFALAVNAVEMLEAEPAADQSILLASLYNTMGGICWHRASLIEAITYVERSLSIYERLGYLGGTARVYNNLGVLNDAQGNWSQAAAYYKRAYMVCQTMGDLIQQAGNLDNLGTLYTAMGQHEAARQELEAGLRLRQRLGDNWGTAQSKVNLAQLALVQGQFAQAAADAESALALSEAVGSSDIQIHARWILALVRAENGDLSGALASAEEVLKMVQVDGPLDEETNCRRVLGILHARAGHYQTAEDFLRGSVDLSLQSDNPYLQAQALLELGRLYQRWAAAEQAPAGRQTEIKSSLIEAARIFEELGAAYDLHLAQAALRQLSAPPATSSPHRQ